jgi:LysR family transcriptional regulator, regulator for metE and metH
MLMRMTGIDLRHLRLVSELSACGSATLAADRLGITQSAVSHQLRELETRLETPVCVRTGKRLVLTPAGQRLLQAAQAVLSELDVAAEDIARLQNGRRGLLRVCAQCHTGYHWLPPLLSEFRELHPAVDVDVAVQHTEQPVEALLDGALDVALLTDNVTDKRLRLRPLSFDEHAAIVPPDHPWTRKRFITPEQLGSENLLLYSRSPNDSFTVARILRPAGVRPRRVRFIQLTEAILEMVKAGLGVSVLPTWAVRPALTSGAVRAVRITRAGVRRQWIGASLHGAAEPAYLTDFLDLVQKTISRR